MFKLKYSFWKNVWALPLEYVVGVVKTLVQMDEFIKN